MSTTDSLFTAVRWNEHGLVAAIAQDHLTRQVLMMAWMNAEALKLTIETGWVHYYSRSRQKLWKKGESSGHCQRLDSLSLDCDGDAILMGIEQIGLIACHTGRSSCFYRQLQHGQWISTLDIIKPAEAIYGKPDQESAHD